MSKSAVLAGLLVLAVGATGVSAQGGRGGGGGGGGGGHNDPGRYGEGLETRPLGPSSRAGSEEYFGPGSGTGVGRCRRVEVEVCRGGAGDGRGPRCRIEEKMRC